MNTISAFKVICRHEKSSKKFEVPDVHVPRRGYAMFCFSFHIINRCPSTSLFSGRYFTFLYFLLAISLFKMALQKNKIKRLSGCNAEVPSSVSNARRKAVMHFTEKIC